MAIFTCDPITLEKIRAEVFIGSTLIAKTPFVKSFNVSKSRTQLTNTFTATLEILAGTTFPLGEKFTIKAGIKDNLKTIFTGIIKSTQVQPAFGLPSYFSMSLSGSGVTSKLENKIFSRRLRHDGQGLFCLITGGARNRPQRFYSLDKEIRSGNHTFKVNNLNFAKTGENSPFIVYNNGTAVGSGASSSPVELAGKPSSGGNLPDSGGTGLNIHTHEDLTQGGPAFAVYSSD